MGNCNPHFPADLRSVLAHHVFGYFLVVRRCTKLDRFSVAAAGESLYQADFLTSLGTNVVTISLAFGAVGSMSLDMRGGVETTGGDSHCIVFVCSGCGPCTSAKFDSR